MENEHDLPINDLPIKGKIVPMANRIKNNLGY